MEDNGGEIMDSQVFVENESDYENRESFDPMMQ